MITIIILRILMLSKNGTNNNNTKNYDTEYMSLTPFHFWPEVVSTTS
jgi:hypothetical protein